MTLHQPPTPIPSPPRGRGGAFRAALQGVSGGSSGHLPPPAVGEGWGGGASPRSINRRAA